MNGDIDGIAMVGAILRDIWSVLGTNIINCYNLSRKKLDARR